MKVPEPTTNPEDTRDIYFHKKSGKLQVRVWNPFMKKCIYGGIHSSLEEAQASRNNLVQEIRSGLIAV